MANENIITSENLEQIPPVPLADNAVDTSIYDTSAVLADLTASQEKARTDVEALQKQGKEESSSIADLQSLMGGKEAETVKTYADTGVTDLYNQLTDIGVQAEGLKREQLAIPHQLQEQIAGTGTTDRGLAPQTAGALRRNALKALTLGQQAAIAGAQYDKAKNYADQIISAKYAQYEADIQAKVTNLNALREFDLSPAEEKLRVATLSRMNRQQAEIDERKLIEKREYEEKITLQKDKKDDIQLYSKYAMEAGQSDIASQINSLDPNSDTFTQDLAKLQSQIKDPMVALDIAIKNQQLALSKAQTSKVYAELATTDSEGTDITELDPNSRSILAQTGLSMFAFKLLTEGTKALTRMPASQRTQYTEEAENWAISNNIDTSIFLAEYEAQTDIVKTYVKRAAAVDLRGDDIVLSLDMLKGITAEAQFSDLKIKNVVKLWAGKQVNDPVAQQYAYNLEDLRSAIAGFFAVQEGRNMTTVEDGKNAEDLISDGLATGSIDGLIKTISIVKKRTTAISNQASVNAQDQIWKMFGVEKPSFNPESQYIDSISEVLDTSADTDNIANYINSL